MNQKIFQTLEFPSIVSQLEFYASSEPGKERCRKLQPETELEEIKVLQQQTSAAKKRCEKQGKLAFIYVTNISNALERLDSGNTLTAFELLRICDVLETVTKVKQYGNSKENPAEMDAIDPMFHKLQAYPKIVSEIKKCIISETSISDNASPALADIRRRLSKIQDRIREKLNSILNGANRQYLQDYVIVQRNDTYCLSVKSNFKDKVPGVSHGQSGTGSTVFIEPQAVAKLNSERAVLLAEERQEIEIILAKLSVLVGEKTQNLRRNLEILTELDFIFAKAQLSIEMEAVEPILNDEGYIHIIRGRHPMLDKEKVVPLSITLGKDYDLLVITGPNTGGKTLTMKTTGLLTLMAQSGLHVPAFEKTQLAVFKEIFAAIGDEQSIAQSLSTFSAQMTNVVHILENADKKSLVLIDELGSGTDPNEGAALAISILKKLHKKEVRTLATTHYSELKTFALSTDGVENACCEFDVETLSPTYRLIIGASGKSNAFAISRKIGLAEDVIQEAKNHIGVYDKDVEEISAKMIARSREIEREYEEIERYKKEIEELKKTLENQVEARTALTKKEEVKQIKKLPEQVKEVFVADFEVKIGDEVRVLSMNTIGKVTKLPNKAGNLSIQMGIMNMTVNMKDIQPV